MKYTIVSLLEHPEKKEAMAQWFHERWGIPLEVFRGSMEECLAGGGAYPQWYVAEAEGRMVGGLGVIENDFHDRKDLAPNVCGVYTDADVRGHGIAGALLNHVCEDMHRRGVDTLYLLTDHTGFYERYGWTFLCMAQGDGEETMSRMYVHRMA